MMKVINQIGESVASVGSSEEDDLYRNDSMKYLLLQLVTAKQHGSGGTDNRTNEKEGGTEASENIKSRRSPHKHSRRTEEQPERGQSGRSRNCRNIKVGPRLRGHYIAEVSQKVFTSLCKP